MAGASGASGGCGSSEIRNTARGFRLGAGVVKIPLSGNFDRLIIDFDRLIIDFDLASASPLSSTNSPRDHTLSSGRARVPPSLRVGRAHRPRAVRWIHIDSARFAVACPPASRRGDRRLRANHVHVADKERP